MTQDMAPPFRSSRRRFLVTAARPGRVVELSCESLYMKYVDARSMGRLEQFLEALELQVLRAGGVRLLQREWLACDDFRVDVGPLLRRRAGSTVTHGDWP